jgi:hypothetical protein
MFNEHLQLVNDSDFLATVSDARGRLVWTGSNSQLRRQGRDDRVECGAQRYDLGTNGTRLVIQSGVTGAQTGTPPFPPI